MGVFREMLVVWIGAAYGVVDVGFFSGGDAAVDFIYEAAVD